jgi:hypothetical protein
LRALEPVQVQVQAQAQAQALVQDLEPARQCTFLGPAVFLLHPLHSSTFLP